MSATSSEKAKVVTVTAHGFRRLDYVDGLRAIGALWVAAGHYSMDPGNAMPPAIKAIWLNVLKLHGIPVMVFLVLSGFCLYYPMAVKSAGTAAPSSDYWAFMKRRARRIMPPFYGAALLCIVLILSVPFMRDLNPQPLTAQAVLHHVLLIHNLFENSAHAVDYPVWSIGLEWQLYLLFPLLVWMIWRWNSKTTFVIAIVAAVLARAVFKLAPGALTFALVSGPLPYCYIMLMGIYAARLTATRCNAPNWALWGGFVLSTAIILWRLGGAFGETFACGSGTLCILLLAIDQKGIVHRILSVSWLAKIGLFSYSIYLLHAPLLHAMRYGLNQFGWSTEARFLVFWLICMPVMLLVSYGFFLVFEKPFIGKTRKIKSPAPTPSVAVATGK